MVRPKQKINTVFVYGTLMRGFCNHELYLAGQVVKATPGEMRGDLYHLNYGYPAAVDGAGTVKGEIFYVHDMQKVLPGLDFLEDYNQTGEADLYKRKVREVQDGKGNIIKCYVYLWSPDRMDELTQNGVYIKHGDWKRFIRENKCIPEEDYESNS